MKKISLSDKIFVAGSSGMVGKAVIKKLKSQGYGSSKFRGLILKPKRKELDLLKQNLVDEWFEFNKPEVVILAAAKVGGILANSRFPSDFIFENLKIQLNVIESAFKHGVKRFLFLGSSCIYPKFSEQPISEENLMKGELEKTNDCYAIAKIAGIKMCEALNSQKGFDSITLMPTNLYGPGDNYNKNESHVVASLIRKFAEAKRDKSQSVVCWGSGNPMREFLHVDDLGDAIVFALENWDPKDNLAPKDVHGNPLYFLNVGTGKDITINELAIKIKKITGFEGHINWDKTKPDGTMRKLLNTNKINNLGWEAKIKLDDGLERTISSFLKENHIE